MTATLRPSNTSLSKTEQRRAATNASAMTWVRTCGAIALRCLPVDACDALRAVIESDADVQQIEKHGP